MRPTWLSGPLSFPNQAWKAENQRGVLSIPQQLGAAALAKSEFDGILYPSWLEDVLGPHSLARMTNLVLFMDPDRPTEPRNPSVSLEIVQRELLATLISNLAP